MIIRDWPGSRGFDISQTPYDFQYAHTVYAAAVRIVHFIMSQTPNATHRQLLPHESYDYSWHLTPFAPRGCPPDTTAWG